MTSGAILEVDIVGSTGRVCTNHSLPNLLTGRWRHALYVHEGREIYVMGGFLGTNFYSACG